MLTVFGPLEQNVTLQEGRDGEVRAHLKHTRWPDQIEGAGWDYGANREYCRVSMIQQTWRRATSQGADHQPTGPAKL
jgi:hypothetical protein